MESDKRRICVNWTVDNRQLSNGTEKLLANNATELFNAEKVVITSIEATSLSSDCPHTVSLSMNIGNGRADATSALPNSAGELYHPVVTDLSADHQHTFCGFQNVLAIQPYEKWRGQPISCFASDNSMEQRLVEKYGKLSMDQLWEGVVPFSGEDYFYVETGSVVDGVLAVSFCLNLFFFLNVSNSLPPLRKIGTIWESTATRPRSLRESTARSLRTLLTRPSLSCTIMWCLRLASRMLAVSSFALSRTLPILREAPISRVSSSFSTSGFKLISVSFQFRLLPRVSASLVYPALPRPS